RDEIAPSVAIYGPATAPAYAVDGGPRKRGCTMRIAVLGTGVGGRTIGSKLVEIGHEVRMGLRRAGNDAAVAWAEEVGAAGEGSFGDAAGFGEIVFNCTAGGSSLDALAGARAAHIVS